MGKTKICNGSITRAKSHARPDSKTRSVRVKKGSYVHRCTSREGSVAQAKSLHTLYTYPARLSKGDFSLYISVLKMLYNCTKFVYTLKYDVFTVYKLPFCSNTLT